MDNKQVIPNYPILGPSYILLLGTLDDTLKPTWSLCGWNSTISYSYIMVSFGLNHKTTDLLTVGKKVSLSIVEKEWLKTADYVGTHSLKDIEKSTIFSCELDNLVPSVSSLSLTGTVEQVLDLQPCKNFVIKIEKTFINPNIQKENGLIDYDKFHPVLFTQPTFEYYELGKKIGETELLPFVPPELNNILGGN